MSRSGKKASKRAGDEPRQESASGSSRATRVAATCRPPDKAGHQGLKKNVVALLRVLVTLGLLALLASQVDLAMLRDQIVAIPLATIIAAVTLQIAAFILAGIRWWLMLSWLVKQRRASAGIRLGEALPSYYIGILFNTFLPTGIGGDAVRTIHLHGRGHSGSALVASALADRLLGLFSILALSGISLALLTDVPVLRATGNALLAVLALAPFALALLYLPATERLIEGLRGRTRHRRILALLIDILALSHLYRRAGGALAIGLVLSLVLQLCVVLAYALLAPAVGLEVPFSVLVYSVPAAIMATLLPVSLGGMGVREGALVGVLTLSGCATGAAVSLSLAYLLVLWIASTPGIWFWLKWHRSGDNIAKDY